MKDADSETLVISFPNGGALTVFLSEVIETELQHLLLGQTPKPLTWPEAIDVLRETETETTGGSGCGIDWSRSLGQSVPTTGEVELDGTVCNCKAHLQTKDGTVIGLGFSTAC